MTKKRTTLLFFIMIFFLAFSAKAEDRRILQSRVLARDFMTELKGELASALQKGHSVQALSICREVAPALAERYSIPPGVEVGRTSSRCRNPENRPDSWEKKGLKILEKRRQQGETLAGMEYWEAVEEGDKTSFRYLRAIPVGARCLRCHGEKIDRKLRKALQRIYPADKAVGYRLGELRGAFTVTLSP